MTRQQIQHAGKKEKPLNVMKGMSCDISVDEVKQLQKDDETLVGWWQKAEEIKDENNQKTGLLLWLRMVCCIARGRMKEEQ